MTNSEKGRFGTIVFENYTKYLHMDKWNKDLLDKYCREYNVGILGFMPSRDETFVGAQVRNASLYVDTNVKVKVRRTKNYYIFFSSAYWCILSGLRRRKKKLL